MELTKKIGITQVLISNYERGRLRPHYEMIIRFALALGLTTEEHPGVNKSPEERLHYRNSEQETASNPHTHRPYKLFSSWMPYHPPAPRAKLHSLIPVRTGRFTFCAQMKSIETESRLRQNLLSILCGPVFYSGKFPRHCHRSCRGTPYTS